MSHLAFVTGAAGGIGSAITQALLEGGTRVVATDIDGGALARLEDRLGPTPDLRCEPLDVTDASGVEAVIAVSEDECGPIDWGVCVAGAIELQPIVDTSLESWNEIFAVNSVGVFLVSRALGARMARRGEGSLVTVASNAGLIPRVHMGAYGASKAAASMLTRTLGLELARSGVRCNVVCAGSTRTAMQARFQGEVGGDEPIIEGSLESFRTGIPLGRVAEPEDIADAVLYLLSDRARHITMAELVIDGGASLLG